MNNFVNGIEIEDRGFKNLNDLFRCIKENHYGVIEKSSQDNSIENSSHYSDNNIITTKNIIDFKKASWVYEAIPKSEEIINNFLKNFMEFPYLHRVEHSIHCDLYNLFSKDEFFNKSVKLSDGTETQILHKEWPEYRPREDKNNRRGNFDFVILSPESVKSKNVNDFVIGKIEAPIVVEIGLNYGTGHLLEDFKKINNSKVYRGYLLHLVRKEKVEDNSIEEILLEIENKFKNIKIGYVKHTIGGVRYKLINNDKINLQNL